jgi:hypothetical protein
MTFSRTFAAAAAFFLATQPALADWSGAISVLMPGHHAPLKARFSAKGTHLRYDWELVKRNAASIVDLKAQKVVTLEPTHGAALLMPFDPARHGIACASTEFEACLKKGGYKVTGREKANGHPCKVYEADVDFGPKGKAHQKLWYPTDLRGIEFVRIVTDYKDGGHGDAEVTDLQKATISAEQFEVPKNLRRFATAAHPISSGATQEGAKASPQAPIGVPSSR